MTPEMVTAMATVAIMFISFFGFIGVGLGLIYKFGKLNQKVDNLVGRMRRSEEWQDSVSLVYVQEHAHIEHKPGT